MSLISSRTGPFLTIVRCMIFAPIRCVCQVDAGWPESSMAKTRAGATAVAAQPRRSRSETDGTTLKLQQQHVGSRSTPGSVCVIRPAFISCTTALARRLATRRMGLHVGRHRPVFGCPIGGIPSLWAAGNNAGEAEFRRQQKLHGNELCRSWQASSAGHRHTTSLAASDSQP
jgi:hypothetical protein